MPATEPYLVMTSPASGWAVWPSGGAWVLLHTVDGFGHVENRTPIGVPTDGGLIGDFAGERAAVAVGPVEQLLRSPLLSTAGTAPWTPAELPGGVVRSRGAVALAGTGVTALTSGAGGTLLTQRGGSWHAAVDARALPGASGLALDSVTWAGDSVGWLTGHGRPGGAVAFGTTDAGVTWTPVRLPGSDDVAALAPCGDGAGWSLPVLDSTGHIQVLRTRDGGGTWTAGQPLPVAVGEPAWGCSGDAVWVVAASGPANAVFSSADGGATWTKKGAAPAGLTDLSPTGAGRGFAASGGRHPSLWSVDGDGARFTRVPLPSWVAALGAATGEH
ncbi:MAG: Photosynthesis system assembly factor [Frankiales bacterium]|nr:Photosynthesis system assembly factor [Frankiales bacterium]